MLDDSRAGDARPEPAGFPRPRSARGAPSREETSVDAAEFRKGPGEISGEISGENCNVAGTCGVQGSEGLADEADSFAAEPADGAAGTGTACTEPVRSDEVAMTRTLDAYAIRLAALKAYDITGVRPRELHRYRAYGEVPDGLSEEIVQRAQKIVEEERARLLRLAGS